MSAFVIRRLEPGHAAAYRTLMLQAYRDETDAFTSTVGEREALPLAWWQARIADESGAPGLVVGAFSAERLVGAAGLTYEHRERTSHKATLVGMYVHPDFRGRGAARALVRATLTQARATPGVEVVQLTVTATNAPAVRLYEACGFRSFGTEPFAVRLGDGFLTKTTCGARSATMRPEEPERRIPTSASRTGRARTGTWRCCTTGGRPRPFGSRRLPTSWCGSVLRTKHAQQWMARVTGNYRRGTSARPRSTRGTGAECRCPPRVTAAARAQTCAASTSSFPRAGRHRPPPASRFGCRPVPRLPLGRDACNLPGVVGDDPGTGRSIRRTDGTCRGTGSRRLGQFAIAEAGSDRLIGDVGVHLEADGAAAELGFTLCREAQGRGHAIRAVEAVRLLIFASTAAGLVRAVTDARNQGSVRVLERAGFKRLAERQALFKGERCTEFVYVCHRSAA